ncbi:MAG TPA: DUF2807 domain-containing protein [Phenylobacterium sp.]|uniref:GIN domain-containing protein n=1 Tax=Phenylobacterium sp. TaxID=1871053 RepID=UPI002F94DED2
MRLQMMLAGLGMAFIASGAYAQSPRVEIKDAVARVTVIPEARSDVKVEFLSSNPQLPLQVREAGGKVIVDGRLDRKIRSCSGDSEEGQASVQVSGVGRVAYANMPQVVVRTPKDVEVEAGGAVFGVIGRSDSVKLSNAGCGDWTVGNVRGALRLNMAGSGDTRVGTSAGATLRVAGSGDVTIQTITGPLDANIAGSGDVWAAGVHGGKVDVKIAGTGDVKIASGQGGAMTASVAGSGDVVFDGAVQSLKARIAGSGDVRVKAVKGEVSKAVIGSGDVIVG